MKPGTLLKYTGYFLMLAGTVLCILLFSLSYSTFIGELAGRTQKTTEQLSLLLTQDRFLVVQISPLALVAAGVVMVIFHRRAALFFTDVRTALQSEKYYFSSLEKKVRACYYVLLGCFIVTITSNALFLPVTYDEAWTYLNFSSRNVLVSATYYPAPNNHILHSILTNFSRYLPLGDTLSLRIPSLFFGVCSFWLLFRFFIRKFSGNTSLLLISFYGFSYPVLYYSSISRGYILLLAAFIGCIYALDAMREQYRKEWAFLFVLSGAAGFYTMPSFLYPWLTLVFFFGLLSLVRKDVKWFLRFAWSNSMLVLMVACLYLPVMIVSGVHSLIGNDFVKPLERPVVASRLPDHFERTSIFLSGIPLYVFLLVLIGITTWLIVRKQFTWLAGLSLFLLLFPPLLLMVHAVVPFPRTWIYLIVACLLLPGIALDPLIRKVKQPFILLSAIPLLIFFFFRRESMNEPEPFESKALCEYLETQHIQSITCQHSLMDAYLRYYNRENSGFSMTYVNAGVTLLPDTVSTTALLSGAPLAETGNFTLKRKRAGNYWLYVKE